MYSSNLLGEGLVISLAIWGPNPKLIFPKSMADLDNSLTVPRDMKSSIALVGVNVRMEICLNHLPLHL